MILHTVNKPGDCLQRCLALCCAGDAILLLEDGVYAALDTEDNRSNWKAAPTGLKRHVLESDLSCRGLTDKVAPGFDMVDWSNFVALTLACDKVVSWG